MREDIVKHGDPSEVIITRASLILPFEFPEDYKDMRLYPTTLPYAVYKVLCLILADPDDDEAVCIEAEKARIKLGKVINDRLDKIMVSIEGENNES